MIVFVKMLFFHITQIDTGRLNVRLHFSRAAEILAGVFLALMFTLICGKLSGAFGSAVAPGLFI